MSFSNLFGQPCNDEVIDSIKAFIRRFVNVPHIEFEAKLGLIKSTQRKERLELGISNMAILDGQGSGQLFFESSLPPAVFNQLQHLLQLRSAQAKSPIRFERHFECDRFYLTSNNVKVRASLDTKGQLLNCINKERLENLDFLCPNFPLDFRLSASIEHPIDSSTISALVHQNQRNKNRCSYFFERLRFDLTEVTSIQSGNESNPTISHEVEIELCDLPFLAGECAKADKLHPSHYGTAIRSFLDNIRSLIQKSLVSDIKPVIAEPHRVVTEAGEPMSAAGDELIRAALLGSRYVSSAGSIASSVPPISTLPSAAPTSRSSIVNTLNQFNPSLAIAPSQSSRFSLPSTAATPVIRAGRIAKRKKPTAVSDDEDDTEAVDVSDFGLQRERSLRARARPSRLMGGVRDEELENIDENGDRDEANDSDPEVDNERDGN